MGSIQRVKVYYKEIAGRRFPFDLFYLVPNSACTDVPKLFPWSLGIPMTARLLRTLYMMSAFVHKNLPAGGLPNNADGQPGTFAKDTTIVVPMHRVRRNDGHLYPAYMMAQKFRSVPLPYIFNEYTTLFTPTGPVRPVCLHCPNHLLHVQGQCALGEFVCYQSLVLENQSELLPTDGSDADRDCASEA